MHVRLLFTLICMACLSVTPASAYTPVPLYTDEASDPDVMIFNDGIGITWRASDPHITLEANGVAVHVAGFESDRNSATAGLPMASLLIAIPPGATPQIHVLSHTERIEALPAGVESSNSSAEPLLLEQLGVMRGVRLARLVFYPAILEGKQVRITSVIRAEVRFNGMTPISVTRPPDPFLATFADLVINPRHFIPEQHRLPLAPMISASGPRAVIDVNVPGITAIRYETLVAAGFPVGDPANLQLWYGNQQVAVEWNGDDDALFEAGEALTFYAAPRFNRYTATDSYILVYGDQPGQRINLFYGVPRGTIEARLWASKVLEENHLYTPYSMRAPPSHDGDRWVWDVLRPDRPSWTTSFGLDSPDPGQPAQVTLWTIGITNPPVAPDHRLMVHLNGVALGAIEWDGQKALTSTLTIPAGVLRVDNNQIKVEMPGIDGVMIESAWIDGVQISYPRNILANGGSAVLRTAPASANGSGPTIPGGRYRIYMPLVHHQVAHTITLASPGPYRIYDVSVAEQPIRVGWYQQNGQTIRFSGAGGRIGSYAIFADKDIIEPARVRVARELEATAGADYLVIAPDDLIPALEPLLALRANQGLRVAIQSVQPIYDAYAGRPEPEAIRSYLARAYATWNPRPAYVLLVGDGSGDPRDYSAGHSPNLIPSYLADVDPWIGETASDNRYVTLDGTDTLPDIALGRLPVSTLVETQAIVAKISGYEQSGPGDWGRRALLVADNADDAGDFPGEINRLISQSLPPTITPTRIVFNPNTYPGSTAQQAILSAWNSGYGLVIYDGHSSIHQWAAERLLHLDDVAALANNGRLPVVLQLTCYTGSFHDPAGPTLDESLVRHPSAGAIATWGSTGLGVGTGHSYLARGFLGYINGRQQARIGPATIAGKLQLLKGYGSALDLLDTFTLLGDPATVLVSTR